MIRLARVLVGCLLSLSTGAALADVSIWNERVRLSGSADLGFFGGGRDSVTSDDGFEIWDARVFLDAELGESVTVADTLVIRNLGFTFEWNLIRNGSTPNDVGLVYLDLEGVIGSPWLNLRVGRFQIPFGEAYKLYSKGYADRSFARQPVGGPWWWDEGVLLHGGATSGRFGYIASLTNGDTDFNNAGGDAQLTLKLWTQPFEFLYLSASGQWGSELGLVDSSLWLGEGWARPFGSGGPPLPNLIDGVVEPDDLDGLGQTWAIGVDAIVTPVEGLRIWLAGGRYDVDSKGAARYDRVLWYWIGEIVVGGELVNPALHDLFVGVRVDGVGTWDDNRGYLLDVRYTGSFGYNMEHIIAYTAVAGWRIGEYVTLRAEYSHRDIDLVRGAGPLLPGRTGDEDVYTFEFGLHF